jgi:hypothetical protein
MCHELSMATISIYTGYKLRSCCSIQNQGILSFPIDPSWSKRRVFHHESLKHHFLDITIDIPLAHLEYQSFVPWSMSFISDRSASCSILQFGKLLDCQSCLGLHTSKLYPRLVSSRELGSYHSGVIKIESVDETLSIWKFFV